MWNKEFNTGVSILDCLVINLASWSVVVTVVTYCECCISICIELQIFEFSNIKSKHKKTSKSWIIRIRHHENCSVKYEYDNLRSTPTPPPPTSNIYLQLRHLPIVLWRRVIYTSMWKGLKFLQFMIFANLAGTWNCAFSPSFVHLEDREKIPQNKHQGMWSIFGHFQLHIQIWLFDQTKTFLICLANAKKEECGLKFHYWSLWDAEVIGGQSTKATYMGKIIGAIFQNWRKYTNIL